MGFGPPVGIEATLTLDDGRVAIGDHLTLRLHLRNAADAPAPLLIDYAVHRLRKNNKTNAKIFKWKTLDLGPGKTVELEKRHSFKPTTIRALYPGRNRVEIQINGGRLAEGAFNLTGDDWHGRTFGVPRSTGLHTPGVYVVGFRNPGSAYTSR